MIQKIKSTLDAHPIVTALLLVFMPILLMVLIHNLAFTILVGLYYIYWFLVFAKEQGGWFAVGFFIIVPLFMLLLAVIF
jgi:hypothetical protein